MATKQMMYETDARAELLVGVSKLARAVKATLGPRGRNVVMQKSLRLAADHQGRCQRRQGNRTAAAV